MKFFFQIQCHTLFLLYNAQTSLPASWHIFCPTSTKSKSFYYAFNTKRI